MLDTSAPAAPASAFPDALLQDMVAVSLAGINLLRPLYGPDDSSEPVDFTIEYLNPAAQRMTGLAERPGGTMRSRFPETFRNGVFALYQRVYQTGEAGRYDFNYQADGFDNYFHVAARRSGELLVVSFTDTADQPRTAVEQALRESQAAEKAARAEVDREKANMLRLFEQVTVAMALFQGPDYVIELANREMQRIWGRTEAQTLGRRVFDALPDIAGQGFEAIFADVLQNGTPYDLQEVPVHIDRDHTERSSPGYFHLTYRPQYDAQGRITGIITMALEVTEQVRARQQLEQLNQELEARVAERTQSLEDARTATERQRRQFEELFMRAPAAICIFDGPEWVYEFVNPGYQAMFPGRPLLGLPLLEALPEVAGQPLLDILHHVYDTGETFEGHDVLVPLARTPDGPIEDIYFDLTYQARFDEAGRIDGFVTYAYDVTEQVRARQEREAQRQQLQAIFAQAPVAVCVFQGEDAVLDVVNASMAEMLGRPLTALVGRPFFEVMPELQSQGLPALLADVRRTGTPFVAQEQKIQLARHRSGEPGYFNYVYQPLLADDGRVTGIVCVATDITEQVRAREQVQDLNRELEAINQELAAINEEMQATNEELNDSNQQLTRVNVDLDNFIYTASHDLKAPISNLEGLLNVLHEQLPVNVVLADNVAPILDFMSSAVERFKRTLDHLTEVSKLQKEHVRPAAALDLAVVVEGVRLDLLPLLTETNAQLTVAVTDFPPVLFSEKNLRSVVYNLLSNALKYRHPDRQPHVDVRARVQDGFTVLEVHDNGLGLEAQHLPRLFTMFLRFHDHVEGSGIGLYMVKRMVENAGGRIEVHSQLGTGTTFFVYLPHAFRPTP